MLDIHAYVAVDGYSRRMKRRITRIVGLLICAVAAYLFVSGIVGITRTVSCGDIGEQACSPNVGSYIFHMVGGSLLIAVGAVLSVGLGVLLALATAGVTLIVDGGGGLETYLGIGLIVVSVLAGLAVLGARQTAAANAVETAGFKARALMVPGVVAAVKDTGVTMNDNPRVAITVTYQREDGSSAQYEHKMLVSRLSIPRPGDTATVWYDPAGPKVLMQLGAPTSSEYPVGSTVAGTTPDMGYLGGSEPEDSVPAQFSAPANDFTAGTTGAANATPSLVTELERLAALHRNGSLTDYEYSLAKQRLLNGS